MAKDEVSLELLVKAKLAKEDIDKIKNQVNNLVKSSSKESIKLGIDKKYLLGKLDESYNTLVNHKLFNKGKSRNILVSVNQSNLDTSLSAANNKLKDLTKPRNVTITASTKNAISGITDIQQMLKELSSTKYKINLDITGVKSAETSLHAIAKLLSRVNKLSNKLNSNSSKVNTKVNLTGLNSAVNKLKEYVDLINKANTTVNTTVNTTIKTKNIASGANSTNINTNDGQTSPKNYHNTYRTMQAEGINLANRAEMAWRNAGNQSSAEFEKFKDMFQKHMEKMVEFRKNLGNLSAGAEANIFKNMARSIQQGTPLYDQLIDKIRTINKERKELNDLTRAPSKTTQQSTTSPKNLHNNYKSMQAEAVQYARQAEMAWRNAGNKSSAEFEKFKNKFQKQMEKMVEFRKNLGNLSAGAEANIFSNMARSIQKGTPLYDQLISKVKQLKKEQAELNAINRQGGFNRGSIRGSNEVRGMSDRMSFLGSLFTGTTQFVGRSSKGFGSFGEAIARVNENMIRLGGTFGKVGLVAAGVTAAFSTVIATGSVLVNGLQTFGGLLIDIGQKIYNAFKPAIELYKSETKSLFGMGAAIQAQGYVGGVRIGELTDDKNANANTALGISTQLLNRAMLDAEKSVFDFSEIIQSLQGTLPMLMSKGFSLDQAYRINMGVAAAAKTLQLAPNQVLQETRDIAQNSITSRTSQVANALHITNAELRQFNGDVEATFNYLMKKFEDYSEMLNKYALTPIGAFERMRDRLLKVGADIVEKIAPMFMGLFNKITDMTGQWVDKQGNQLDIITNKWKQAGKNFGIDKNGLKVEGGLDTEVGEPTFEMSDSMIKVKDALIEIIDYTATAIDTMWEFAKSVTGVDDPIGFLVDSIKVLVDATLTLGKATVEFGKIAYDAFYSLEKPIMVTIALCNKLLHLIDLVSSSIGQLLALDEVAYAKTGVSIFGGLAGGIAGSAGGPAGILAGAIAGAKSGDVLYRGTTEQSALEKYKESTKRWGESFESLTSPFGELSYNNLFQEHKKDGILSKAFEAGKNDVSKLIDSFTDKAKRIAMGDVKGNPNGEKNNSNKEALKQQKKMLDEQLRGLRETLKDALSELKDTLNRNKIAYDEGFMSIKDYFTQKAEIEAKEAELRLTEAMEELEKINSIQWENEYDKDKELHRVNREIRQYSRELGNAKTSIVEVNKAWKEGVQSLNSFTAFIKNTMMSPKANFMQVAQKSGGAGITSTQGLLDWGANYNISNEIVKEVVAQSANYGVNADKYAKMTLAMMIQESGGDQNQVSSAGAVGLMQLMPDTAAGLGVNPYDWKENIAGGLKYIDQLAQEFGWDVNKIIAAYNAGPKAVKDYGGVPPYSETQNHVKIVRGHYDSLESLPVSVSNVPVDVGSASSQIDGAASVLLSAAGELLGYTPEEQYSRGGLDTRYAEFQSMSSGVDAQISGMNDYVKQIVNLINKMYYERTGTVPTYSSFTGDMTGATSNPHSSAPYGHQYGFKTDAVGISDEKAWVEIHELLGAATRWEKHHWDSSYGPGSTYKGGWGTDYYTGDAWWNKVQSAQNVSVRDGGLGFLPGVSFQTSASTTETGSEMRKKIDESLEYIMGLASKVEDISLETVSARLNEIKLKYDKEFKKLEVDMKKYPELGSSYETAKENLKKLMDKELADTMTSFLEKRLSYLSDYSKTWGSYNAFETFMGRGMPMKDFLTEYHKYYFNDDENPLAPASVLSKMWDSVIEYQRLGAFDKAQELRNKILDKYDELNSIFTDYLSRVSNYFDNYSTWLSNTDATSLQKERGEREIRAKENEVKSDILGVQISNNEEQLEKWKLALDEVLDKMEKIKKLQEDDSVTEEEKKKNKVELDNLEIQRKALALQSQKLEMTNEELKVQKLLADQQKQQPDTLKDLGKVAKQSLEDGLVTFLTDGVNEAENLGEALRNLAVDFLKTMQEFFAKQIVTGLMNKWFPVRTEEDEYGINQTPFAMATGYNQKFVNPVTQPVPVTVVNGTGGITAGIDKFNYPILSDSKYGLGSYNKYSGLGAFSSPWESSTLNANSITTEGMSFDNSFGMKPIMDTFSNNVQQSSSNFNLLNGNLLTTQNTVNSVNQATKAAEMITTSKNAVEKTSRGISESEATSAQLISSTLQQLSSKLQEFSIALQTATSSIQSVGTSSSFSSVGTTYGIGSRVKTLASGGMVYGEGTSTSDSIPAMLSNGEAVLNAKAVNRLGTNFINAVNSGSFTKIKARIPHLAEGGVLGDAQQMTARGMTDFANSVGTNVSTTNQMNIALVRDEREAMEHFMRSPAGQRVLVDFQKGSGRVFSRFGSRQ